MWKTNFLSSFYSKSLFFRIANFSHSHTNVFKLQQKLNETDEKDELPLDLALKSKQESIAKNLVKNHIDINKTDSRGFSLLHKAIFRGLSKFWRQKKSN